MMMMTTMMTNWKPKQRTHNTLKVHALFVDAHFLSTQCYNVLKLNKKNAHTHSCWRCGSAFFRTNPIFLCFSVENYTQRLCDFFVVADFEFTKTIEQEQEQASEIRIEKKTRKTHLIIMNALIPVYRLGMNEASRSRLLQQHTSAEANEPTTSS